MHFVVLHIIFDKNAARPNPAKACQAPSHPDIPRNLLIRGQK
jgi:hypothetical protein